jgi:hypothetical protein
MYIKGSRVGHEAAGCDITLDRPDVRGQDHPLSKLEDENPVHYRLHQLSVDHALATSWLDALAYAPRAQSSNVPVDGVRKIAPQSFLVVLPPRHPYIMVV